MIARIHRILPPFAAVLLLTLTGCGILAHRGTWERDTLLTVLAARFPETHSGD